MGGGMTNEIVLTGITDVPKFSHSYKNNDFYSVNITTVNQVGDSYVIPVIYKKVNEIFTPGNRISVTGNIRSHSVNVDGKNHVSLYVFSHFDAPLEPLINQFEIEGNLCKKTSRLSKQNKQYSQFIIANNLLCGAKLCSNYLPCVCFGELSKMIEQYDIGTALTLKGEMRSKEYTKKLPNGEIEIHVAHELFVNHIVLQ